MKRVLIVCDTFPPAYAPRMGYLCKHLHALGWTPVVLTADMPDRGFHFLQDTAEVHRLKPAPGGLRGRLREALFHSTDRRMVRQGLQLIRENKYDLILCSTFRIFPLRAATELAEQSGLKLVVDLRDILEEYAEADVVSRRLPRLMGMDRLLRRAVKHRYASTRNRLIARAEAVTTVSDWHVSLLQQYHPCVRLIYNGFDEELFFPAHVATSKFTLTYTGRLISTAMRNPELLFQAIGRLHAQKLISAADFEVRWYVDAESEQLIRREAGRYPGVATYMSYHAHIPAEQVPTVLNASNMLLLLTNRATSDGPHGIMTTKFFEFMAVGLPILNVTADGECIERALCETRAGLAAHQADEVQAYLLDHYRQWQSNHTTPVNQTAAPGRFSRSSQARQFADLFAEVTGGG